MSLVPLALVFIVYVVVWFDISLNGLINGSITIFICGYVDIWIYGYINKSGSFELTSMKDMNFVFDSIA